MLRRSVSVVTLLLLFLVANSLRNIDWCQYFRLLKRDHMRPECNGIYRLQLTAQRDHPSGSLPPLHQDYLPSFRRFVDQRASVTEMTKKALGLRDCSIFSTSCRESKLCEPGLICHSWAGYCCENKSRERAINMCYASGAMDIPCNSLRFTRWCFEDFHCRNTPRRKCCPTRCGYKICH